MDKNFIQISIVKNLFICVLCVPIALCLSALTVFSLTKIAETPYDFYISAKSVVISVLLPFVLTTATTLVFMFEQLKKWLDENAAENEIVTIELDGVFQARVSVEGGEKVFAFEADGEIKNLIKDDAAIEK